MELKPILFNHYRTGGNNFSHAPAPPPPPFTPPPPNEAPPPQRVPPPPRHPAPRSPPLSSEPTAFSGKSGFWTGGRIAGVVVVIFLTGVVAVLLLLYVSWRRRGARGKRDDAGRQRPWRRPLIPHIFTGIGGLLPFKLECFKFLWKVNNLSIHEQYFSEGID